MNMITLLWICIFPLVAVSPVSPQYWLFNVGQGQWSIFKDFNHCVHLDAGGEFFPKQVVGLCKNSKNTYLTSHADRDHVRWIGWLQKTWNAEPESMLKFELIHGGCAGSSNAQSRVFSIEKKILVPGDSPKTCEEKWARQTPATTQILILGHHGSKTSTSENLLSNMPNLRMAIASSRYKRYHHPAHEVVLRLKKKGIPTVRTEQWGNIIIEL